MAFLEEVKSLALAEETKPCVPGADEMILNHIAPLSFA